MKRSVGVIGLGYIGLPLALSFCEKGYRVVGVEVNEQKVGQLIAGYTDVLELYEGKPLQDLLQRHLESETFVPTSRAAVAAWEVNAYIVTVGIPVIQGVADETPLLTVAEQLGKVIKPNDLVLIRSTVIPGILEDKVIPLLEQHSRMRAGEDFHVAYAAERVAEGRAMEEFQTLDVVLAGLTDGCYRMAAELLGDLTSGVIHRTDLRTAQAVKVIENVQRDVNIALSQQIAWFSEYYGVNVYELIRMANTHPRVHMLEPSIGVGGFCIPNAYHYLQAGLQPGQRLPLLELAREINETTPERMIGKLVTQLAMRGKSLRNSTIAVLGLGMKDFSNDIRLSPAVRCAEVLIQEGATVRAFDPTVTLQLPYQVRGLSECLHGADGLLVATWQHEFEELDFASALAHSHVYGVVVDLKRRLRHVAASTAPDTSDARVTQS
ncbi:MAG: hypothetical protein A2201_12735 [Alicyclobacillus sp. RIFOXYA1_FULL_53_8]|nr:MAG: hypothetical protein A2201_12735 [Alicyclobacillus sp. RIFOXYA1_FULL_53_8]